MGAKWRESIPILKEVTASCLFDNSDVSFFHTLQIIEESSRQLKGFFYIDMKNIIKACKLFYSLHLKEEKKHLSSLSKAYRWYEELQKRESSLSENTFIARLGWGSGFDGVTINYARAHRETKRSRRLAEGEIPLGWAEVSITKA